jgi:hypothetical protein
VISSGKIRTFPHKFLRSKDSKQNSDTHSRRVEANRKLERALSLALAPKTTNNYDKSVRLYLDFAKSIGVSEQDALPCSEEMLCLFLAQGIGRTGPGNAKNLTSGIRQWHVRQGLPWRTSERVKLVKKALYVCWPKRTKDKITRPAITPEMMKMLAREWNGSDGRECCAMAMALAAWCGQMRLGELMPEDRKNADDTRLPARFEWATSTDSGKSSTIELPWTKTTRFEGATIFLLRQRNGAFDATKAMIRHLKSSPLDEERLLCEYVDGRNRAVMMDKMEFMEMCNEVWAGHGLERITGHSFRIGGTTALLRAGVNPQIVKQMGRWHSDAFLLYWRSQEEIFASHAADIDWEGGLG